MKYIKLYEKFYNPSKEIKDKLDSIIKELLNKYDGGKQFFDKLDDSIRDITNQDMILSLVRGNDNKWIAASGKFGDILSNLYDDGKFKCKGIVVFNGKMLTKDKGVTTWYPANFDLNNKQFVFIDDSLFSGSTYRKIDAFLNEHDSSIESISVIYDGSKTKDKMVSSFFRYYK